MKIATSEREVTVTPKKPFSTKRLLIGYFVPAVECLKRGLESAGVTRRFWRKVILTIEPKAFPDHEFSEVEERVLMELGHAAGAYKVTIRSGT